MLHLGGASASMRYAYNVGTPLLSLNFAVVGASISRSCAANGWLRCEYLNSIRRRLTNCSGSRRRWADVMRGVREPEGVMYQKLNLSPAVSLDATASKDASREAGEE